MIIDLRNVMTRWINLDEHIENAKAMEKQFSDLGFLRHQRISASKIPPPVGYNPAYGKHFIGCGTSHIRSFGMMNEYPTLVLEDDCKATAAFTPIIEVPDDTDAVYLGVSTGNPNTIAVDMRKKFDREENKQGWARICNMLATHAILYVSERYAKIAESVTKKCTDELKIPLDMGLSQVQNQFNIYAPIFPFFVQADERESENKWEFFTNKLRITHTINDDMEIDANF